MPEPIASTYVEIKYDQVPKAHQAIDKMGAGFNKVASDIDSKAQKISRAFGALGGAIASIGIAKFGSDIIGASTRMDSLNRAMTITEGSAQKASARMKEFVQIAKDPGLGLTQLAKGYIQLKSVGLGAELAVKSIRNVANAIALVGGGKEQLEGVIRQFTQMQGKGKVMASDFMIIAESMPQIREATLKAFPEVAKSTKGITEALQDMGISGKEYIAKVTEALATLPRAADGARNAQDNFTDALERFRAKLGDTILPTVTKFLNGLTDLMGKFEAMPASTQKLMGTAVVGGVGLLGISTTLLSIVSTIGLVKSGLSGLGAVNVASAGAGMSSAGKLGTGMALGTLGTISIAATTVLLSGAAIYNTIKNWDQPLIAPEEAEKRISENWQNFINKLETQGKTQASYAPGASIKDIFGLNKSIDLMREAHGLGYDLNYLESLDDVLIDMQRRLNDFKGTLYETKPLNIDTSAAVTGGWNVPESERVKNYLYGQQIGMESLYGGLATRGFALTPEGIPTVKPMITPSSAMALAMPTGQANIANVDVVAQLAVQKQIADGWALVASENKADTQKQIKAEKLAFSAWEKRNKIEIDGLSATGKFLDEQQKTIKKWSKGLPEVQKVQDSWNDLVDDMSKGTQKIKPSWDYLLDGIENATQNTTGVISKMFDYVLQSLGNEFDKLFAKSGSESYTNKSWESKLFDWLGPHLLKGATALATSGASIPYLGLQKGGSGIVTKPTMMIIGEGGQPEAFNVQPLSRGARIGNTLIIENISISLPNMDINNITEDQIYRLVNNKIVPAMQRVARGGGAQLAAWS